GAPTAAPAGTVRRNDRRLTTPSRLVCTCISDCVNMERSPWYSFPGSAWERTAPEALPRRTPGRRSLPGSAFPGRAWERESPVTLVLRRVNQRPEDVFKRFRSARAAFDLLPAARKLLRR